MRQLVTVLLAGMALVFNGCDVSSDEGVIVKELRCEYGVNPLGIDAVKPRLGWVLQSEQRGQKQTAYQVLVAGSEEKLKADEGDLWDSGRVESDQSVHVSYNGRPLKSYMRCYWKVRAWDKDGNVSAWSGPAMWSMGLLEPSDWKGHWIGAVETLDVRPDPEFKYPAILLRKEVEPGKKLVRATAYICGLGYYELYLNGRKVGDHVLDPGYTDFSKRLLYVTYDVTDYFKQGRNAIGVILGNGWYSMPTGDLYGFSKAPWTAPQKLLLNIDIEFADGSRQMVTTDTSWKWSTGPIIFNCLRGGESYDARRERVGWNESGYDESNWQDVKILPAPSGRLISQQIRPIRVVETIRPVKLTEALPGVFVFDLGVNIAGWVRFRTSGERGQKVTLQFHELLKDDGTLNTEDDNSSSYTLGRFQTGELILNGRGVEVFEPRFTYHGFRYVQVTGLTQKPTLESLTGCWVHTDVERVGEFSCSNEKLNKIDQAVLRSQLNSMHGIHAEPLREKMGWTQDVQTCMEMAIYNFDVSAFYRKWFHDMLDAQESNGHMPAIAPICGWGNSKPDGSPGEYSDPWWGGAIVYLPYTWYRYYGDKRILEEGYEGMKKWVDYIGTTAEEHIVSWSLGDWGEPGTNRSKRTPIPLAVTCGYFYCAKLVSNTALLLGRDDDAKKYGRLAENIKASFNKNFFDPATGLYAKDSQTAQILPLYLGMVPQGKEELVLKRLIENIHQRQDHLSTGFVGILPLMHGLTEFGYADLAYTISTQEDSPGWLYMLKDGGTTIWEYWNDVANRNNSSLGGPFSSWCYLALGGIRLAPDVPAFKKIVIKPEVVGDLTWAKASHKSIYGRIVSEWERKDGRLTLNVTIPANTTATVYVPTENADSVTESGKPAGKAESVKFLRMEDGAAVYRVGSGSYAFVSNYRGKQK